MHHCREPDMLDDDDLLCRYCLDDMIHGEGLLADPAMRQDAADHLRELRAEDRITASDQRARYRRLLALVQ